MPLPLTDKERDTLTTVLILLLLGLLGMAVLHDDAPAPTSPSPTVANDAAPSR